MSSEKGENGQTEALLSPTFSNDDLGRYISVVCGRFTSKLYVDRVDLSKRTLGKCVLYNGKWDSPSEFETLGGKRAKKWRQSLFHLGKRLCEYNLSTPVANSVPILSYITAQF